MKEKVSIVIGVYNSEKTVGAVIDEIHSVFRKDGRFEYEIILVDDFSPDNVYDLLKEKAKSDKRLKVLHLAKNSGQTNAVIEGYRYAKGSYIVEMDDDFQMPAAGIISMLDKLIDGNYDVVFAKYPEQKESAFRRFGSRINNKMTEIMLGRPKDIRVNSFLVMRRFVAEAITKYTNNYPYLYGMIFAITKNVGNVLVEHRPRTNGRSNYTFKKLLGLWLDGFLNFSVEPLRIATRLGSLITIIGFLAIVVLFIERITGPTQAMGWTSIMITIIFFAGVQLLGIGLLGEYLGRLFISDNGLPRTTIKETINCEEGTEE